MTPGTGTYTDGVTLRAQPVVFELSVEGQLRVSGEGVGLEVPINELRTSDALGGVPGFVYLPKGGVIETADRATVAAIGRARGQGQLANLIHFLESHRGIATGACAAVAALFVTLIYLGPPALARVVAHRLPKAIELQAGKVALGSIAPYLGVSALSDTERQRVRAQLERLLPGRPAAELPRLEFRTFGIGFPNAFALPGGILVVSDELVRLPVEDDELAAVLAHELAHVEKRHGLQSVLRNSTALLIVTAITGDLATLTSLAATVPFLILRNGYSRDFEREADRYARELLLARGINPKHFSSLLLKLETARSDPKASIPYLSTHPGTDERSQQFTPLSPAEKVAVLAQGESQPQPVYQVRPYYPAAMIGAKMEGEVLVDFVVDIRGEVQNAWAVKATRPEFQAPAIAAVQRWKFRPGTKGFRTVPTHMQVPIVFTLDEEPPPVAFPPKRR